MARILITSAPAVHQRVKHLGNLVGSQLPADVYARYMRARGHEVLFICATDEHGTPAELAAAQAGEPVADYCARLWAIEWLIVVSNLTPRTALAAYRKRWAIECLFGDANTRGLNLEDTRLTDPRKLDLLMALVALALAWAGRTAACLLGPRAPKRKTHGYYAQSWFRTGFDRIRNLLRSDPLAAIHAWLKLTPILIQTWRVV